MTRRNPMASIYCIVSIALEGDDVQLRHSIQMRAR